MSEAMLGFRQGYADRGASGRSSGWERPQHAVSAPDRETYKPAAATSATGWQPAIKARIAQLRSLMSNWDGRGSAKPQDAVLSYAASLLAQIMGPGIPAPSMIPLGDGTIQLVWSRGGAELEVEIMRPSQMVVLFSDTASGAEEEWQEDDALLHLSRYIERMRA